MSSRPNRLPLRRLLLAGLLVAGPAAGCSTRPTGLMQPVGAVAVAGATPVPLLVATTRRRSASEAILFTGERGPETAFSSITVSVPPNHREGEIEWPTGAPGDPASAFVTTDVTRLDRGGFAAAVRGRVVRSGGRALVFVHGFNNRFDDAVYRFAQIAHDTGAPVAPILFTWPSRGQLLAYPYDRESANYSRDALEALLQRLVDEPAVREVAVLAHSMGNWVALEALRQIAIRRGQVPAKIRDVMLAAPDVDVDVARTQIDAMGERRPRFTLFVSQDDEALTLSKFLWGSTARLGSIDPRREPYRTALLRARIEVVDLTSLESLDGLNHSKFAQAPQVVQFIGRRLSRGQSIDTRQGGFGEAVGAGLAGVVGGVGNVAAAAATVPFAAVDEDSRDALEGRLGRLLPGTDTGQDGGEAAAAPTTPSTKAARR